jgi:hypothetical protein
LTIAAEEEPVLLIGLLTCLRLLALGLMGSSPRALVLFRLPSCGREGVELSGLSGESEAGETAEALVACFRRL